MQLKNLQTSAIVPLPNDLLWTDEYAWTPTASKMDVLITGAIVIQSAIKQAGRPITLSADADMGWVPRSTVETIREWAGVAISDTTGRFELTLHDGRVLIVAFRHDDTPIDASPVLGLPYRNDNDWYNVTVRFLEI